MPLCHQCSRVSTAVEKPLSNLFGTPGTRLICVTPRENGLAALVNEPRSDQALQRLQALVNRFQKVCFVDEIDRLRQEYITYSVRVPVRREFTNTLSGSSYSFSELNFGEYSYAVLNPRMLAGLASINQTLGWKIAVTSCYRNPHKQVTQIGRRELPALLRNGRRSSHIEQPSVVDERSQFGMSGSRRLGGTAGAIHYTFRARTP